MTHSAPKPRSPSRVGAHRTFKSRFAVGTNHRRRSCFPFDVFSLTSEAASPPGTHTAQQRAFPPRRPATQSCTPRRPWAAAPTRGSPAGTPPALSPCFSRGVTAHPQLRRRHRPPEPPCPEVWVRIPPCHFPASGHGHTSDLSGPRSPHPQQEGANGACPSGHHEHRHTRGARPVHRQVTRPRVPLLLTSSRPLTLRIRPAT